MPKMNLGIFQCLMIPAFILRIQGFISKHVQYSKNVMYYYGQLLANIELTSGCLLVLYYDNLDDKESVSIIPV